MKASVYLCTSFPHYADINPICLSNCPIDWLNIDRLQDKNMIHQQITITMLIAFHISFEFYYLCCHLYLWMREVNLISGSKVTTSTFSFRISANVKWRVSTRTFDNLNLLMYNFFLTTDNNLEKQWIVFVEMSLDSALLVLIITTTERSTAAR